MPEIEQEQNLENGLINRFSMVEFIRIKKELFIVDLCTVYVRTWCANLVYKQ